MTSLRPAAVDRFRWFVRVALPGPEDETAYRGGEVRSRFGFGLRAIVTAALVGLLAWGVDWNALLAALAGVRWSRWILALAAYLASQGVSAWRWAGLARSLGFQRSYVDFLKLYFEGVFFNQCLPSSIGGDVVKALRLGQTTRERLLAGATVLGDRLTGLAALLVLAAAGIIQRQFDKPAWTALATILASALAFAAARLSIEIVDRISDRLGGASKIGRGLAQLAPYRERPAVLYRAIGWSFIVQLLVVVQVGLLGEALSIDVSWVVYFVVAPIVSLLATLPLTFGSVGLREAGVAELLAPSGVAYERGLALGMLWYLVALSSGLLGGAAYLWRRKQSRPGAVN